MIIAKLKATRGIVSVIVGALAVALPVALAVAEPGLAVAQEATPTAVSEPTGVSVTERFPWWDVVGGVGAVLGGVGALVLAASAAYAAIRSLRQYLDQRRRETDLALAKLYGDLVGLLKDRYGRARSTEDEEEVREDLEKAADVYEGILRGIITVRPELMKAAREAVSDHLGTAARELEALRLKDDSSA